MLLLTDIQLTCIKSFRGGAHDGIHFKIGRKHWL